MQFLHGASPKHPASGLTPAPFSLSLPLARSLSPPLVQKPPPLAITPPIPVYTHGGFYCEPSRHWKPRCDREEQRGSHVNHVCHTRGGLCRERRDAQVREEDIGIGMDAAGTMDSSMKGGETTRRRRWLVPFRFLPFFSGVLAGFDLIFLALSRRFSGSPRGEGNFIWIRLAVCLVAIVGSTGNSI